MSNVTYRVGNAESVIWVPTLKGSSRLLLRHMNGIVRVLKVEQFYRLAALAVIFVGLKVEGTALLF